MSKLHIQLVRLSNDYLHRKVMDRMDLVVDDDLQMVSVVEYMAYMIRVHRRYDLLDRNRRQHDLQLDIMHLCRKHVHMD